MDEVQGPTPECAPTPINYSSLTITKVENGYLLEARDKTYSNQRNLVEIELNQALETARLLFS